MKKSDRYQFAMIAIIQCGFLTAEQKVDVLETLMADKSLAVFAENDECDCGGERNV